ncbi:MAG TPA: hypothetical protein VNA19_04825 [Pyrinomonadaceae bacterium]|nr:hypothetical protein [Pyrinomonadaceae bacterium]
MNRVNFHRRTRARFAPVSLILCSLFALPATHARQAGSGNTATPTAPTQNNKPATVSEQAKAEQIIERAIAAAGGSAFLGVQSIVSRGYFTPFKEGISLAPLKFTDYLVYPDRERTEFSGQGIRNVQTNTGTTGWVYDNTTRAILDIKPEQVKDFQTAMRTSVDNLLRGWWRKEGARLSYAGRREAGLARRNEVVRLSYADGFAVEFEFGAKDNLLYKVRYRRPNPEGEETEEEDRFAQHLTFNGVTMPFIIDHYRAGTQTSRINYDTVEFNRALPDSLFARPADIKALNKSFK